MTVTNPFIHEFWVDLKKGLPIEREKKPLSQGDAYADRFVVRVQEAGKDVDLSGVGVSAKVIRYDGQTVPLMGEVADGAACVTLDAACYTVPGDIRVSIALSAGDMVQSVLVVLLNVETSQTSVIVDNGVIGDLSSLLGAIADMQAATAEARAELEDIQQRADALFAGSDVAPAIVPEISGDVAVVTDAAARDAVAVVSTITAVQEGEGDPSAKNIRPITGRSVVSLWHGAAYDASAEPVLTADLPEVVYGGTLDWVSGVLTVTHRLVDADSASWKLSTNAAHRAAATIRQAAVHACTHYPSGGIAVPYCYYRSSASQIAVQDPNLTTLEDFTSYFAAQKAAGTPVQFWIEDKPENQMTIQLTPQQLTMIKGSNALWSDTGGTSVVYVADTKMYIDNALAAIAASIINQ